MPQGQRLLRYNRIYLLFYMLYQLAHVLRDRLPWIWDTAEWLNGLLFSCRYGKRLRKVVGGGNLQ